ncbi:hypothetical protein CWC48_10735 [Pseudomonas sp. S10E 269]|nr:hypothetical protein CWC49_20890 [Pseudomonas sp. S09F 262]PJK39586.1 hypothetical protein CWC48_10735 [Pseudomonas sp. S10E 269]
MVAGLPAIAPPRFFSYTEVALSQASRLPNKTASTGDLGASETTVFRTKISRSVLYRNELCTTGR